MVVMIPAQIPLKWTTWVEGREVPYKILLFGTVLLVFPPEIKCWDDLCAGVSTSVWSVLQAGQA